MRVEHVLFDLDGTLADSRADLAQAVNHVRGLFELAPLELTTVCRFVGDGARALVERAFGVEHRVVWERALEAFLAYYAEHLLDETRLYPGMGELLGRLSEARIAASVLTNKPEEMSRRILAGLGVLEDLVGVVGGDSLARRKPAPDGVFSLIDRTGTRVEGALLVGDSPVDAATAVASGVAFCGVGWGLNPEALATIQVPMVQNAEELAGVILGG